MTNTQIRICVCVCVCVSHDFSFISLLLENSSNLLSFLLRRGILGKQ